MYTNIDMENAFQAIGRVFRDRSYSQEETLENLQDLKEDINSFIQAIQEDIS